MDIRPDSRCKSSSNWDSDDASQCVPMEVKVQNVDVVSSKMHCILEEFSKLYSEKIRRVGDMGIQNEDDILKRKVAILESWVEDVNEQNGSLVDTVEELEREASQRVALLQEKIEKLGLITKESCVSYKDHQIQISTILSQKMNTEDEAEVLRKKVISVEHDNVLLRQENAELLRDLDNLGAFIARAQMTGKWEADDTNVNYLLPSHISEEKVFCRNSTEFELFGKNSPRKTSLSSRSQMSFSQECEENGKEKDSLILRQQNEIQSLKSTQLNANDEILQRDKHIADLQAQLTDFHHQLSIAQSEADDAMLALSNAKGKLGDVKRFGYSTQLSAPSQRLQDALKEFQKEALDGNSRSKTNTELQLSENIDIMASRLCDYDEEFHDLQELYHQLKSTHGNCQETIRCLSNQRDSSNQNLDEMRTVLTAEVADRHDQVLQLKLLLQEAKEKHRETSLQLQLKMEVIKELRRQLKGVSLDENNKIQLANEAEFMQIENRISYKLDNIHPEKVLSKDVATNTPCYKEEREVVDLSVNISKLENEIAEKNMLIRDLQTHLASSRLEVTLKDEVLNKIEIKLDMARSDVENREERMLYLTSQLTLLQLEVSKLHGQTQQLTSQLQKQSDLMKKLEKENTSLCWQLNNKSCSLESAEKEAHNMNYKVDKREKENAEQKMTITALQDYLVETKQRYDQFHSQPDAAVSPPTSSAFSALFSADARNHEALPQRLLSPHLNSHAEMNGLTSHTHSSYLNSSVSRAMSNCKVANNSSVFPCDSLSDRVSLCDQFSSLSRQVTNLNVRQPTVSSQTFSPDCPDIVSSLSRVSSSSSLSFPQNSSDSGIDPEDLAKTYVTSDPKITAHQETDATRSLFGKVQHV